MPHCSDCGEEFPYSPCMRCRGYRYGATLCAGCGKWFGAQDIVIDENRQVCLGCASVRSGRMAL